MNYYIGLDAHSSTCTAVVVDEKGEQKLRATFSTTEANLMEFILKVPGVKHLTFEECTLSQWLYLTLVEQVDHLLVCNPVYVAKKQGAKTDYRDALHLAQELRTGHLKPVYHDNSHWIELRVLTNNYLALVDDIVRAKNRLKAVFRGKSSTLPTFSNFLGPVKLNLSTRRLIDMDNTVLKKRLSTFRTDKGILKNVSDELLMDILRGWESWTGTLKDFYSSIGVSPNQMAKLMGRAKKLKREGVFPEEGFKEIKLEPGTGSAQFPGEPCIGIELSWAQGKVIRFAQVEQLVEFLKKAA